MSNKCRTKTREPDLDEPWAKVSLPMSVPLMVMVTTIRSNPERIDPPVMGIAVRRPARHDSKHARRARDHNL